MGGAQRHERANARRGCRACAADDRRARQPPRTPAIAAGDQDLGLPSPQSERARGATGMDQGERHQSRAWPGDAREGLPRGASAGGAGFRHASHCVTYEAALRNRMHPPAEESLIRSIMKNRCGGRTSAGKALAMRTGPVELVVRPAPSLILPEPEVPTGPTSPRDGSRAAPALTPSAVSGRGACSRGHGLTAVPAD